LRQVRQCSNGTGESLKQLNKETKVKKKQRVAWLYNDRTITLLEHGTYDFQDFQLLEKNLWLDVEWKAAKTPVRVVALHMKANFDVSSTELREREAKALAQELGKVQGPLIVTGDFNDFDLEIDANALLRSTVLSTVRKSCGGLATAGELQPLRTTTVYGVMIDHVLVNKHLQFESCIVHKSADLQETPVKDRTSDHYPISCSIALKK
jgi:endonuclease/exonuclease/phosphatase family metal-dependent hydrolase